MMMTTWNADHHGRLEVIQVWMVNGVKDMKSTPIIFNGGVPTLLPTGVAQGIHVGDASTTAAYQSLFVSQWLPVK